MIFLGGQCCRLHIETFCDWYLENPKASQDIISTPASVPQEQHGVLDDPVPLPSDAFLWGEAATGVLTFQNFASHHSRLQRHMLVLGKFQRVFTLVKKGKKNNAHRLFVLHRAFTEAAHLPQRLCSFPRSYTQQLSTKLPGLWVLCEPLCFICKTSPKVIDWFRAICLTKDFTEMLSCWMGVKKKYMFLKAAHRKDG